MSMRHAFALLALLVAAPAWANPPCDAPVAVCDTAVRGALPLIDNGRPAGLLLDAGDHAGVLRAAADLQADLAAVSGKDVVLETSGGARMPVAIIAGTLGHSARVDAIVRAKGLDVSDVDGRWEGYLLQVVDAPEPGIGRALLIAGADMRGTIFGLYELSRRLGVSPWQWWADVPAPKRTALFAAPGRVVDAPAVRYRGIFINDEDPALGGWMRATYGGPNHQFYERVFQLLLRHKANYLWPAMWGRAFYDDDPENAEMAALYGVIIGTSHHEPMMRAHVEWRRHGSGDWDYARNRDGLQAFWRAGIERLQGREAVVTLGMRGDGDEPMSEDTATRLLEGIVADQRRILSEVTGKPADATPQVWALYKEVQDYFDAGMRVPDDVTLLFADDNWGNIRRMPGPGERRAGGYGVYYHFDYVGGPRNYKWINTTQIERMWEQMRQAYTHGVDRLWIVNVGDIKPMELPISAFLDQAWNPEAFTVERLARYPADWAAEQFGPTHAREIGDIVTRYTQYNARRKPELLTADTWSLLNFGEAERVLGDWQALAERTSALGRTLPASQRDAWYQLVEYPVLASANLNAFYIAVARNRLHADQGRADTNAWADEAERLFARDAELARVYEQDIAGGKWIHMMSQPRIGYTHWQMPDRNVLPALARIDVRERGTMGVAVEGDARGWPLPAERARLPELDPYAVRLPDVQVFNRGSAPFRYTTTTSEPWLRVGPSEAEVGQAQPLRIEIDWDAVPAGRHLAHIDLLGSELTEVRIEVPVHRPQASRVKGFVESEGHIAIEAEHHSRAVAAASLDWQTIPHIGRTRSGLTAWPTTQPAQTPGGDGMRLEYPVHLHEPGEVEVRVVVSPTLDVQHRGGLRYAVSFGDAEPQLVEVRLDPTPGDRDFNAWERAVADSVHVATSRHRVEAGSQTLKLWLVDPGLVFQRIEVVRDPLRPSYLGPPESMRR